MFCDLCIKEIDEGNRPTTFFNKVGWDNITSNFIEVSGKNYTKAQLKNKWDGLKKDWKLWREFKVGSTGLGWDPKRKTIAADDDWWREKLKVFPNAKKFKIQGIDPEMEEKLNMMFEGVVATGSISYNPNITTATSPNTREKSVSREENANDSDDCENEPNMNTPGECSNSKRPRSDTRKGQNYKKSGQLLIHSDLSNLVNAVNRIGAGPSEVAPAAVSAADVIKVLDEIPELAYDDLFYMNSVRIMENPTVRELFMSVKPSRRVLFLRHYYERP